MNKEGDMSNFKDLYRRKLTTSEASLRGLPRRSSVLLGFFAAQPPSLVQALADGARAGNFDECVFITCTQRRTQQRRCCALS